MLQTDCSVNKTTKEWFVVLRENNQPGAIVWNTSRTLTLPAEIAAQILNYHLREFFKSMTFFFLVQNFITAKMLSLLRREENPYL